jgi:hypothetical protein
MRRATTASTRWGVNPSGEPLSANNARRHRTGQAEVIDLYRRRRDRATLLLELRDRLAVSAAQYDAHDLEEANELVGQVSAIESAVKALDPHLYNAMWAAWVARDVELAHDSRTPSPECAICRLLQAQLNPWDQQPGQVG